MKFEDIHEAPMGMLNRLGQTVLSKIPGNIGAKAQGKLDTGRVANAWEKEFLTYLGRVGQSSPSTETLSGFLKTKNFTDDEIKDIIGESKVVYERVISDRELDAMMLKAAQRAASGTQGTKTASQLEPTLQMPQTSAPASTQPAPQTAPTRTTSPAKTSSPEKQTPTTGVNNYLNSWAKSIRTAASDADKMELAREMIKFLGDRAGTPQGKMLAKAAEMVIKRLGDPSLAKVAQGFKKFQMERANYVIASYILNEVGLSWKDIGMKVVLSESTTKHVTLAYR